MKKEHTISKNPKLTLEKKTIKKLNFLNMKQIQGGTPTKSSPGTGTVGTIKTA